VCNSEGSVLATIVFSQYNDAEHPPARKSRIGERTAVRGTETAGDDLNPGYC
jgi:hypothetical protein